MGVADSPGGEVLRPFGAKTRGCNPMTTERSDQALARRLVVTSLRPEPRAVDEGRKTAMDPMTAEILPAPEPPKRPEIKAVPPREKAEAAPAAPYGAGYEMLSETLAKTREIAQQTALQLVDARLHQARMLIDMQQKLLEMAQANMAASFAAAQKIVASTSLQEALAQHKRFAQDQVSALTGQASELRSFAGRLSGETAEPFAAYWSKSFERIRKTFGA
jgi:hypothetical protein